MFSVQHSKGEVMMTDWKEQTRLEAEKSLRLMDKVTELTQQLGWEMALTRAHSDRIAVLKQADATLLEAKETLEHEIYDIIFYEPHGADSWGRLTNKQLVALNELGRRLAYKRTEAIRKAKEKRDDNAAS